MWSVLQIMETAILLPPHLVQATNTYTTHIKLIRIIYTKTIIIVRAGLWIMKAS